MTIRGGRQVTFAMPYPPTANNLFVNRKGGRAKSPAYHAWMTEALWRLQASKPGTVEGAYHLEIFAAAPDRRARDIDNLIKPLSDAITQAGIVSDDSMAQSVYATWEAEPVKGGAIRVVVTQSNFSHRRAAA